MGRVVSRWWAGAVAVTVAAVAGLAAPAAAAPGGERLTPAAVDDFVGGYLERSGLPGAVVAVTKGREVVHVAGYGRDSAGRRMSARTPMPIASLSKSMTALAVMQLIDAGKVSLNQPVRRYLPEFTMDDPRAARITVRQLLNQTSGMADSAFPDPTLPQADSLAGAVTRLRNAPLADDPGKAHHYHNPNYHVAARLVEVVGGVPFDQYLRERVFQPLGMTRSSTVDTTGAARDLLKGHVRAYGRAVAVPEPDWFAAGSAGVVTTAEDLAQWLVMNNNGGTAANGSQLVSRDSLARMHTPTSKDISYGLGWWEYKPDDGPLRIAHTGFYFTYTADQVLLPDSGYGIAVVTNSGLAVATDSGAITEGLIALAQGETPAAEGAPTAFADYVLAVLALATLAIGILGLIRSRRWAGRRMERPLWRAVLRLTPYAIPVLLLATLTEIVGYVFGGRAGTMLHLAYVWPALLLWFVVAAAFAVAVVAARTVHCVLLRRSTVH